MNANPIFKTKELQFDFSGKEIRIYRKGYNYLTIPFSEVGHIEVGKGKVVRNAWLLGIITGLLFFLAAVLVGNLFTKLHDADRFTSLNHSDIRRIGANIVISITTMFFAFYFLYSIIKREVVLKINRKKGPYSLREINSKGEMKDFSEHLKKAFAEKLEIRVY
jgi:hypothetical protein